MLDSVATGTPPGLGPVVCVDINPATVTKLADRGSSQARGIVTDVGLFLEQACDQLAPEVLALLKVRRARYAASIVPPPGPVHADDGGLARRATPTSDSRGRPGRAEAARSRRSTGRRRSRSRGRRPLRGWPPHTEPGPDVGEGGERERVCRFAARSARARQSSGRRARGRAGQGLRRTVPAAGPPHSQSRSRARPAYGRTPAAAGEAAVHRTSSTYRRPLCRCPG